MLTVIIASAALVLTGCANPTTPAPVSESNSTVAVAEYDAVMDVRTPTEWMEGHVDGAILFSVEESDFIERLQDLNPEGDYFVYCRTGNRAGQAIEIMRENGFTGELVNGGSVEDAAKTLEKEIVQ